MAKSHDQAARKVAKILGGRYRSNKSPDVKGPRGRAEVKSVAEEVSEAMRQLGGGSGSAYIVLPKSEHPKALKQLKGRKTGLMDYLGNVTKPSNRKRT